MASVTFLGSKQSGFNAMESISYVGPVQTIISIDDQQDQRSAYTAFRDRNAIIVPDQKAATSAIIAAAPDFIFVHGWYWLLPSELTSKYTVLGVHNSLLPKYRGGAPLVWAIINGEHEVGSSIFKITDGMDEGEIYGQARIDIAPGDHIGDILPRLDAEVLSKLPSIWRGILEGVVTGQKQDHSAASYCAQRRPDDGQIDWKKPATQVHNFIRAQSAPYPGAFSCSGEDRFHFQSSAIFPHPYLGTPGQVVQKVGGRHVVACGDGNAVSVIAEGLKVGMRLR